MPSPIATINPEVLTLIVPKIYGGVQFRRRRWSATTPKASLLYKVCPPNSAASSRATVRSYWGGIGTTAARAYAGAVICLLAMIGFFLLDGKQKWWILAAGTLTILMSWGAYFRGFNVFLARISCRLTTNSARQACIIVVPRLYIVHPGRNDPRPALYPAPPVSIPDGLI